jgi:hypothetical protein
MVFSLSDAGGKSIAVSSDAPVAADLGRATEVTLTVSSAGQPQEYRLEQNYPNPFNPTTTIAWQLPADSRVVLKDNARTAGGDPVIEHALGRTRPTGTPAATRAGSTS